MFKHVVAVVGALLFCLFIAFAIFIVVTLRSSGGGCGGTLATGRSVGANSDGWSTSATFGPDTATITTAGHTIVVAPTQLIVDGSHYGAIDESVKSVLVTVRKGDVSFVADGQSVGRNKLTK